MSIHTTTKSPDWCETEEPCSEVYPTDCITYTGETINCAGVVNGMDVTTVVNIFLEAYNLICTTTTTINPADCVIGGTAIEIAPFTTTTTTTTIPSTTTTTTFNINNQLSFYYGWEICLFGGPLLVTNNCTSACDLWNSSECIIFYVSPLCAKELSVDCILYTDNTLTTQATSFYDGFYSDGANCYEVVNGVVVNVSVCLAATTTTTTLRIISDCTGIDTVKAPVQVNGNLITSTYTGTSVYEVGAGPGWFVCSGSNAMGDNVWLGFDGTPFTYTINFSIPVNNIRLRIGVLGVPCDETFTFTTSSGDPTITAAFSCFATINGNQITGGLGSSFGPVSGGGGEFIFTVPSSYTSLTISGTDSCGGSLFGIVCSSI